MFPRYSVTLRVIILLSVICISIAYAEMTPTESPDEDLVNFQYLCYMNAPFNQFHKRSFNFSIVVEYSSPAE
ncbi:unnamed protein product [Trichobilharzia szidati]|nr:unnamed protein product [Trichobilharzia szidati]